MNDRIEYGISWKLDKITMWLKVQVQSMTKMRQDYDVTDCTSVFYVKIRTELSQPIGKNVVYPKN